MSFKRKTSEPIGNTRTASQSNITYFEALWNTPGTYEDPYSYKDFVIPATSGDLLVVFWASENQGNSTTDNGMIQTTAGSTTAWTQISGLNPTQSTDCSFSCAWANVTATNNVAMRAYAPVVDTAQMGIGGWIINASAWANTPAFTPISNGNTTAQVAVTIANPSTVLYATGDFWANNLVTNNVPAGSVNCVTYNGTTSYSIAARYWVNQTPGTRIYGLDGLSGIGMRFTGCVITVDKP